MVCAVEPVQPGKRQSRKVRRALRRRSAGPVVEITGRTHQACECVRCRGKVLHPRYMMGLNLARLGPWITYEDWREGLEWLPGDAPPTEAEAQTTDDAAHRHHAVDRGVTDDAGLRPRQDGRVFREGGKAAKRCQCCETGLGRKTRRVYCIACENKITPQLLNVFPDLTGDEIEAWMTGGELPDRLRTVESVADVTIPGPSLEG